MENSYTLTKVETGSKAAKYIYSIVNNETGEVINTRKSNRDYVAATIDGNYFFGRMDLIGKGDHGRSIKHGYNQAIAVIK